MAIALTTKPSKFKWGSFVATGRLMKIVFRDGLFYTSSGDLVVPVSFTEELQDKVSKSSTFTRDLLSALGGLSPEEEEREIDRTMMEEEAKNATGNHTARHKYVKVKSPYGHH